MVRVKEANKEMIRTGLYSSSSTLKKACMYCLMALVSLSAVSERASAQTVDGYEPRHYEASQLLDGFGALLIAPIEPVLMPVSYAQDCSREGKSGLASTGCGAVGFLLSPLYLVRDVFCGVGDIATFGYFRLSRSAGVFEPFN